MAEVTLEPVTDDSAEAPEWVSERAKGMIATAHEFNASLVSVRGTHPDQEDAWVYVATAAKHSNRWQIHFSYFDEDGETQEAAFGATVQEDA